MLTSEFTKPLEGEPYFRNVGLIKVVDRYNRRFNVGEIALERFDDQNYQYVITPYWNSIDEIPNGVFQGIPGINMDVRKSSYYRVNITPIFISMRTPSESRENVLDLMNKAGLDYYDRFEWLLRTEARCGDDNFVVVKKQNGEKLYGVQQIKGRNISRDDIVEINNLSDFSSSNSKLVADLYQFLQSGAKIYLKEEKRFIEADERNTMIFLLKNMLISMDNNNRQNREEGILVAKNKGIYSGRKPIAVDEKLLKQVANDFRSNLITEQDAMKMLGIGSRSTFYRKLKSV